MRSSDGLYLDRIDHLRGWAAMLVLIYHSIGDLSGGLSQTHTSNPLFVWIADGHTGVSMFLVLSGFILTIVNRRYLDGDVLSYRGFIFNRFVRIFPLLIFVTAIAIATRIPTFKSTDLLPLLTLQLYAEDTIGISSEWAVGTEFQAYFVFPLLLLGLRSNGIKYLAGFLLLMISVKVMLLQGRVTHNGSFYYILLGRIDQIVLGMMAASVYLRMDHSKVRAIWCVLGIVAGLAGLTALLLYANSIGGGVARYARGPFFPAIFHASEGVLWAVVLMSYVLLPVKKIYFSRVWAWLGEISFSLYLLHSLIIVAVHRSVFGPIYMSFPIATYGDFTPATISTVLFVIPTSLAVAYLSYLTIEKPAMAYRRPYIFKPAAPQPV